MYTYMHLDRRASLLSVNISENCLLNFRVRVEPIGPNMGKANTYLLVHANILHEGIAAIVINLIPI